MQELLVKEEVNGPPLTVSPILPFPKTLEEDDEKPSSKQIDLPAHRKEDYFLPFC